MKLLMLIVESAYKEQLEVLLNKHDILGYTEIPRVFGSGETGVRMGSNAFPKTSSIIFTVISHEALELLQADIKRYCEACEQHMKMIVWGVEEVI